MKNDITAIPVGAKAVKSYVTSTLTAYGTVKVRLHVAAIAVLAHAATYGECSIMTAFHKGLMENDADMLRSWFGKKTAFKTEEGKDRTWLGFDKEKGFFVKTGTEASRVIDTAALYEGDRFYNKASTMKADPTLEEILKYLATVEKNADKKAEKGGAAIPAELVGLLASLTKAAKAASVAVN